MSKKLTWKLVALLIVLTILVTACGATPEPTKAPEPTQAAAEATKAPEPTDKPEEPEPTEKPEEPEPAGEATDFVTWYQFDPENDDPANDEAVGNAYLRDTMPQFNEAHAGQFNWITVPKAWEQMPAELAAAVMAGGDVPDLMQLSDSNMLNLVNNGSLQDITEWAQAQSWWGDMDPNAIKACSVGDKLYCLPIAEVPYVTFVWADLFPDGYPTTPEEFEAEAARLKAEGINIWTYFGSTDFDGAGAIRATWTAIAGFGGAYDDGNGFMQLATPENIAAVEFLRKAAQEEWTTEVSFAGGFQEEEAFKDASAASIPTGMFGYRYIRPLKAPNGTEYVKETEEDMLDAIEAGDVILAPFVGGNGNKPGCGLAVSALSMPVGAQNPEGAYAYLNWLMTNPEQNADWVIRGAAGIPGLTTTFDQPEFQSNFYQQAKGVVEASECRPWQGSLTRTEEAKPLIMNAIYKLVKEDPTADIYEVLQAAADEYNAGEEGDPPPPPAKAEATEPEPAPSGEVTDVTTWYQFDPENDDPANDEAVGNAYLRDTMPQFNEAHAGQFNWITVPKAWEQMPAELAAAVMAGGDVPDLMQLSDSNMLNLVNNGSLQDITEWAQAQSWWGDMDPNAIKACSVGDKLYCLPIAEVPYVTFVWADLFPDGYPTTPEEFEAEAARLKAEGINIWTYFGSTDFDGAGAIRATWTTIAGFGGAYDDGNGNMNLNTPENAAAIEFLRKAAQEGWTTEVSFAGGFQEEEAFKDASAASIPTGMFGYRYIRPLKAPNGTEYVKETEEDMLDAIEAGDVILAPFVGANGNKPGCGLAVSALSMPLGAPNPAGAYAYLNWLMTNPEQNADWVIRGAAGIPGLTTTFDQPEFQSNFYQQAKGVVEASECRPWQGSLTRTEEAKPLIMNAIYKLVKEDPTADIGEVLQQASDEYNAGN